MQRGRGRDAAGAAASGTGAVVGEDGVVNPTDLTREDRAALENYTGMDYKALNALLRGQRGPVDGSGAAVARLDAIIARGRLGRPVTLYRGASLKDFGLSGAPKVGQVLTDRAYLSTSTSRDVAANFARGVTLRISAPRGTKAVGASRISGGGEREVVLGRGTKLRVTGVSHSGGTTHIDAEVVR